MNEVLQITYESIKQLPVGYFELLAIFLMILLYVGLFFLLMNKRVKRAIFNFFDIFRSFSSFLFILDDVEYKNKRRDVLSSEAIEKEIILELMDRGITRKVISSELQRYCDERLHSEVRESIKGNNEISESYRLKIEKQTQANNTLLETLLTEQKTSTSMKSRLTNLFILFTLVMLIANFTYGSEITDTNKILVGITYVTLSSFLIFIIRTSHQRSAMLISIQEDLKKQSELSDFFIGFKKNKELTEHDVEFLRMIMVSRAERESKANHPYEVMLKNVSGSNIQLGKSSIKLGSNKETASK
ncbi:hypothetical protein [Photobacterium salinisoli]|uniref:hypothetical protein n=1 Tax=Photobacterium salinisoli TaxID=1616783 RepID=UPI0013C51E95|nr:hypothetical protein [Photobacterium salinisoli]